MLKRRHDATVRSGITSYEKLTSLPCDEVATPMLKQIMTLGDTVFEHAALNNDFYDQWRSRRLTLGEFEVFSVNYFARVRATVGRLSNALTVIDDWESRIQLLHNLSDELGHGQSSKVHIQLLHDLFDETCRNLGGQTFRETLQRTELLPATLEFIDKTDAMCKAGPLDAAGAILAQEWHGYTQIAYLLDGFNQYSSLFDFQQFHERSEYFYVHLGSAEKEHMKQAGVICSRLCQSADDLAIIEQNFNAYLDLLAQFWGSIAQTFLPAKKHHYEVAL